MSRTLVELLQTAGIRTPDRATRLIERRWVTVNGKRITDPDYVVEDGVKVVLSDPPEEDFE